MIDPIRNREFAEYMEKRSGFHRGQIDGILTEMVDAIRSLLSIGQPVTIEGLGTFHTSLTSPGFERPEQVTPGKVSVSRVYFVACPEFSRQVKKMKCTRIPFNIYMPENMLTKEMKKRIKRWNWRNSREKVWESTNNWIKSDIVLFTE